MIQTPQSAKLASKTQACSCCSRGARPELKRRPDTSIFECDGIADGLPGLKNTYRPMMQTGTGDLMPGRTHAFSYPISFQRKLGQLLAGSLIRSSHTGGPQNIGENRAVGNGRDEQIRCRGFARRRMDGKEIMIMVINPHAGIRCSYAVLILLIQPTHENMSHTDFEFCSGLI